MSAAALFTVAFCITSVSTFLGAVSRGRKVNAVPAVSPDAVIRADGSVIALR